jgi:hypothetical protein
MASSSKAVSDPSIAPAARRRFAKKSFAAS